MRFPAILVILGIPGLAAAQAADTATCYATPWFSGRSGHRLWPDNAWQSGTDTTKRSSEYVTRHLAGSYRMVEVTTEGAGLRHYAREWHLTLTLAHPDSVAKATWWARDRPNVIPLAGLRSLLRAGALDSTFGVIPKDSVVQAMRLTYRAWDHLALNGAPFDVLDGTGGLYWIYEVAEDGSFSGRWVEGGLAIHVTPSPAGELGEQPGGYFCAFKLMD